MACLSERLLFSYYMEGLYGGLYERRSYFPLGARTAGPRFIGSMTWYSPVEDSVRSGVAAALVSATCRGEYIRGCPVLLKRLECHAV